MAENIEDAVLGVTRKLEVLENLNLEALRAAVRSLKVAAHYTLEGRGSFLWQVAKNLETELLKLENVR